MMCETPAEDRVVKVLSPPNPNWPAFAHTSWKWYVVLADNPEMFAVRVTVEEPEPADCSSVVLP